MIRISPEMRDAAESIIRRSKAGVLTDDPHALAKYLDQQARKRTQRLVRAKLGLNPRSQY